MKTIQQGPIEDLIKVGKRFAIAGQTLTIDLVRRSLEHMPRGEEIVDIEDDAQPQEIDLLRRRSVY